MATLIAKSTCSLDIETVRQLEGLAKRWNTSKSAALRRAIRSAAEQTLPNDGDRLNALDPLQDLLALDRESAGGWENQVMQERRAASRRNSR